MINKLQTQDRKIVMGFRITSVNNTFDIFYSTDGINYYKALINSRVTFPSIGSTAVVTIPVDSNRLKLVNVADPTEFSIEYLTPEGPPGLVPFTDGFYYSYMDPMDRNTCSFDGSSLYVWRSSKPLYDGLFYEYPSGSFQEASSTCMVGKALGLLDDNYYGPTYADMVARWSGQGNPNMQISISGSYGESCYNVTPVCLT